MYILLFLAFLIAGSTPRARDGETAGDFYQEADEQIYVYIRGKVGVALLVAVCDACILWAVGLDLWLVFGVLSFWLQFVPNVGMAIGVCLPMPSLCSTRSSQLWAPSLPSLVRWVWVWSRRMSSNRW